MPKREKIDKKMKKKMKKKTKPKRKRQSGDVRQNVRVVIDSYNQNPASQYRPTESSRPFAIFPPTQAPPLDSRAILDIERSFDGRVRNLTQMYNEIYAKQQNLINQSVLSQAPVPQMSLFNQPEIQSETYDESNQYDESAVQTEDSILQSQNPSSFVETPSRPNENQLGENIVLKGITSDFATPKKHKDIPGIKLNANKFTVEDMEKLAMGLSNEYGVSVQYYNDGNGNFFIPRVESVSKSADFADVANKILGLEIPDNYSKKRRKPIQAPTLPKP